MLIKEKPAYICKKLSDSYAGTNKSFTFFDISDSNKNYLEQICSLKGYSYTTDIMNTNKTTLDNLCYISTSKTINTVENSETDSEGDYSKFFSNEGSELSNCNFKTLLTMVC